VPTSDWIEDAVDLLEKDEEFGFVLIGGHYNATKAYRRARVSTQPQLEWLKRRFDEWYEQTKAELT
jgi:hypothetical protein